MPRPCLSQTQTKTLPTKRVDDVVYAHLFSTYSGEINGQFVSSSGSGRARGVNGEGAGFEELRIFIRNLSYDMWQVHCSNNTCVAGKLWQHDAASRICYERIKVKKTSNIIIYISLDIMDMFMIYYKYI